MDAQVGQAVAGLLSDLIRLVILALGTYVAAYVRGQHATAQVQRAEQIGRIAVHAAEQLASALGWNGKAKYSRALEYAQGLAGRVGLKLSPQQWQMVIEAAVRALSEAGGEITRDAVPPKAPPRGRPPLSAMGAGAPPR